MASSSAILAVTSGYENPMWLTPVPCVPPMVACGTKVTSTPLQSAVSSRSATASQSRCRSYQRTDSGGADEVMWTWW